MTEHSKNKKVPISVPYFSSSRRMAIFILVGKAVLLVCIKCALIMPFPARIIIVAFLNYNLEHAQVIQGDEVGGSNERCFLISSEVERAFDCHILVSVKQ